MVEIPVAAVERNKVWIEAVTSTLKQNEDSEFPQCVMKEAGKQCATQLLEKIIAHFGRRPRSVDEFIEAINLRRKEVLHDPNLWEGDGNTAHFKLDTCWCDLVQASLAEPNAIFGMCSSGMFEHLFQPFCQGTVRTEIVKSIGLGNECCEFIVHFE